MTLASLIKVVGLGRLEVEDPEAAGAAAAPLVV